MSYNLNTNLLKTKQTFFATLICLGILITLAGQTVKAQQEIEPLAVTMPEASEMPETPGFIDNTFRPTLAGVAATISRTLVQPDGKILVAGLIHVVNGASKNGIARFNPDGTLDTTFNTKSGANGSILALGLQSDGKIIIGGTFTNYSGQTVGNIARLNPDGSFDVDFNRSTSVANAVGAQGGSINEISVLPDNKIYIGGSFTSYSGTIISRLARLHPHGNLDTSFAVGTGANTTVQVIKQYTGGKILIGGSFTNYNGTAINRLARINSDGNLDTSFNIGTGSSGVIRSIVVQPDDKILVGGTIATFNTVAKNGIARLNSDGSDDSTLTVSGTGANILAIARQSDGKLVVGGIFPAIAGTTRQSIARLNADGTFDATFDAGTGLNTTGIPLGSVNDLALLADGSVILVGAFTSYNGISRSGIARANTNGTLDAGLAPTATQAGNIWAIYRQTDGKVLIGGSFSGVNGTARTNVARLNTDGSLDTSFDSGTGANGLVESFAVQPDGKTIVGGEFTTFNGTPSKGIVRLNTNGSIDTSFVVGTGIDGAVFSIVLQADGKVLVGGVFPTYNSVAGNNLVRLNTDGSRDTSLVTGTGPNSTVRKIVVQADAKILVGGDFATYNGSPRTRLMRINSDGSADASFVTGTISSGVNDFVLQADGKIALVGGFTSINSVTRNRIARLNSDGSLDTSFDPGAGVIGGNVNAIAATADGKYLVGGAFTTGDSLPKNRIVRVRANGSIDHKFLSGLGPLGATSVQIRTIVPYNGKFLIGGQFETYNTSGRSGLVLMSNATQAPVDFDGDGKTDIAIYRHYGGLGPMTWWINYSSTGKHVGFDFGIFTVDVVQPGDYDGDGVTDVALWRARSATGSPTAYYIILSTTNSVKGVPFGLDGDRPVTDDYDGDGKLDLAVWREPGPSQTGQSYWIYQTSSNNPTGGFTVIPYGMRYGTQLDQCDKPSSGDFDGDGKADFRVQRRVDFSGSLSTPGVLHSLTSKNEFSSVQFGWAGDRNLPGDYDGDGKTDLVLVRGHNSAPSQTNWFLRYSSGAPDAYIQWGAGALDSLVQGDYDGDGTTDIAVYRRAGENNFYIRRSSDLTMQVVHWGQSTDACGPACDIAIATFNNR